MSNNLSVKQESLFESLEEVFALLFLSPFMILGWQCYTWLKYGAWPEINLLMVFDWLDWTPPFTSTWLDIDEVLLYGYQVWLGWIIWLFAFGLLWLAASIQSKWGN